MIRSSTVRGNVMASAPPKEISRNFFAKVIIEHFKDFVLVSHEKQSVFNKFF